MPETAEYPQGEVTILKVEPNQRTLLDITLFFEETAAGRMEMIDQGGKKVLQVNPNKFANKEEALRKGISEAAYIASLKAVFRTSRTEVEDFLARKAAHTQMALRLRGMKMLKEWEPAAAEKIAVYVPAHLTALAQFDFACEQYLLTGKFPEGLSEKVNEALSKLPVKDGLNPLDFMTQERRTIQSAVEDYFEKYIAPLRAQVWKIDRELKKTQREDYVPPQFRGERAPMNPEAVRGRVEPPIYGLYLGRIFRYDPELKKLVAEVTEKSTWAPEQIPENVEELTKHSYTWKYIPGEENVVPLPYKAFPLPFTIEPEDAFMLMRDRNGSFSLEPKKEILRETEVKFTFVIYETAENEINDEPLSGDTEKFSGPLDEKSRQELDRIRADKFLSEFDQSASIDAFTRKRFVYPEDNQMGEMDERYKAAGENLRPEMDSRGIADCHWSNINASLMNRELGIPSRVSTGFFVKKDDRLPFAAIGGEGHAWTEVWDRTTNPQYPKWEVMDATPGKKEQKEEEEEKEDLKPEDIQAPTPPCEITEEMIAKVLEGVDTVQAAKRDVSDALFKARTNVSPEKWRKVKEFIDQVNRIAVPKEDQIPETSAMRRLYGERITTAAGTLEREFQKLFALICEHRKIPRRTFRGPVPMSEGARLRDPATAAIDVLSGSTDPGGYEVEVVKNRTVIDVKAFEEDVLVDLTASMNDRDSAGHIMRVEQKKLILGMLYHLMRLNASLNDSRTRSNLRTPVQIKSEIFGVRGVGDAKGIWSILKTSKEAITEQLLVQLADELDKTTAGQGDALSALRAYRKKITQEMQKQLKSGELVKMLTIYSDGMIYCLACGKENHDYQIDVKILALIKEEVRALREMDVIVQGVGFTEKAGAIRAICGDEKDPDAAVIVEDTSKALPAQQRMLIKHLKKL